MKTFFILFIFIIVSNFCSARIVNLQNSFDNSNQIYSFYKNRDKKCPQILIFKKSGNEYYMLAKSAFRGSNYLSNLENAKIKINNQIFSQNYRIWDYDYNQHFSFKFSDSMIKEISYANSIAFQLPVHINEDTLVGYYQFSIPPAVLDEWKQVIAME